MKRLIAAVCLLIPIVWLVRYLTRPQVIQVDLPQPIINVQVPPASTEPRNVQPLGRFGRFRAGVQRNKVFFDVFAVAILGLAIAIFGIYLTRESNQISDQQTQLLGLQTELQERQSLPNFVFDREFDPSDSAEPTSEWLVLSNSGGIARNVDVELYTVATMIWEEASGEKRAISDIGVLDFDRDSERIPQQLDSTHVRFGATDNLTKMRSFLRNAIATFQAAHEDTIPRFTIHEVVRVVYQDYQGNEHTEYYSLGDPTDPAWTPRKVMALPNFTGEHYDELWYNAQHGAPAMKLWLASEPSEIERFVAQTFTQSHVIP